MGELKILIVDDEQEVVDILVKRLVAEGYIASTATTGREALSRIASFQPDLILMDIILPDLDGAEVVRKMQMDSRLKYTPVIFLSGIVAREGERHPEIKVGNQTYQSIGKPFFLNALITKIEQELSYKKYPQ